MHEKTTISLGQYPGEKKKSSSSISIFLHDDFICHRKHVTEITFLTAAINTLTTLTPTEKT